MPGSPGSSRNPCWWALADGQGLGPGRSESLRRRVGTYLPLAFWGTCLLVSYGAFRPPTAGASAGEDHGGPFSVIIRGHAAAACERAGPSLEQMFKFPSRITAAAGDVGSSWKLGAAA